LRYSIAAAVGDSELSAQEGSDEKTSSDVQGSGRILFALAKIVVDLIDDELQVSDSHKCAGKKVDMVGRLWRGVTGAANKASNSSAIDWPCTDCPHLQ
jgi:hypothetical protein